MQLTQAQYHLIMSLATSIPRIFDTSDAPAEVEAVVPDRQLPPAPAKHPSEPDQQIVDLLPELPTVARKSDGTEVPLWSTMELCCDLSSISLELFDGTVVDKVSLAQGRIGQVSLNAIRVNYKSLSDGSMAAEVGLKSMKAKDSRAKAIAHRNVLAGASDATSQLMLSYTQSGSDGSRMLHMDLDSPMFIASPDYLMAVASFFTSPAEDATGPATESRPSQDRPHDEPAKQDEAGEPAPSLSYRINIVRPKLTLLADPSRADSDAVRFKIDRIIITQQRTLSIAIARLGALLRSHNAELVQFLDDLDFQATLDQSEESGNEHTAVEVHLTPFVARVSLSDIFAINSIYQTAMKSMQPEQPSPSQSASETASVTDVPPPSAVSTTTKTGGQAPESEVLASTETVSGDAVIRDTTADAIRAAVERNHREAAACAHQRPSRASNLRLQHSKFYRCRQGLVFDCMRSPRLRTRERSDIFALACSSISRPAFLSS